MALNRSYKGGIDSFTREAPSTEDEVLEILSRYIKKNFPKDGNEISREIKDSNKHIIKMDDEGLGNNIIEGDTVAYGCFSYSAKDHSVQKIWEYKFEIKKNDGVLKVYVSDWFGTTVETWNDKVRSGDIY